MPQVRREQRERGKRAAEDDQRGDDDPQRTDAIEEIAQHRGAEGDGDRREAKCGGDGLSRPAEFLGDGLEEDAERVDEQ